jgi:hypothetical protein
MLQDFTAAEKHHTSTFDQTNFLLPGKISAGQMDLSGAG